METITNSLLHDEKILWQNTQTSEVNAILSHIRVIIILILFMFSPVLIGLIPGIPQEIQEILPFIAYFLIPLGICFLIFDMLAFIFEKKDNNKAQITWKERKNYEMFALLTNKRWIQRDLGTFNVDLKKYSDNDLTRREKDIVYFNLDLVKCIEYSEIKYKKSSHISLHVYFNYDKTEPIRICLCAQFQDIASFQQFDQNIRNLLEVKREESKEKSNLNRTHLYF